MFQVWRKQDKMTGKTKWSGDRQSTKRHQRMITNDKEVREKKWVRNENLEALQRVRKYEEPTNQRWRIHNTWNENTLKGHRRTDTEEWIRKLEQSHGIHCHWAEGRKQACLRDLWDNIKYTKYLHYRGPRRRREREKGPEKWKTLSIQQSPCLIWWINQKL